MGWMRNNNSGLDMLMWMVGGNHWVVISNTVEDTLGDSKKRATSRVRVPRARTGERPGGGTPRRRHTAILVGTGWRNPKSKLAMGQSWDSQQDIVKVECCSRPSSSRLTHCCPLGAAARNCNGSLASHLLGGAYLRASKKDPASQKPFTFLPQILF